MLDIDWICRTLSEDGILRDFGEPLFEEAPELLLGGSQWRGHDGTSCNKPLNSCHIYIYIYII